MQLRETINKLRSRDEDIVEDYNYYLLKGCDLKKVIVSRDKGVCCINHGAMNKVMRFQGGGGHFECSDNKCNAGVLQSIKIKRHG